MKTLLMALTVLLALAVVELTRCWDRLDALEEADWLDRDIR